MTPVWINYNIQWILTSELLLLVSLTSAALHISLCTVSRSLTHCCTFYTNHKVKGRCAHGAENQWPLSYEQLDLAKPAVGGSEFAVEQGHLRQQLSTLCRTLCKHLHIMLSITDGTISSAGNRQLLQTLNASLFFWQSAFYSSLSLNFS